MVAQKGKLMCYAGACNPTCDNCTPKYLVCPQCGTKTFLTRKQCPECKYSITDEDRNLAREEWRKTHPFLENEPWKTRGV